MIDCFFLLKCFRCEVECVKVENVVVGFCEFVMVVCMWCFMYVMLSRGDVRCFRCEVEVLVKFGSVFVFKR